MSDMTKTPVKVGYLVTGLVFLGLAGSWALHASGAVDDVTVGWMLPAILVGAGVIGLLAMLAGGVRNRGGGQELAGPASDAEEPEEDR